MINPMNLYELCSAVEAKIPPRSRLYQLAPIGLGTIYVESLTGYVIRLAEAHSVFTRTLITKEILPLFHKAYLSTAKCGGTFWSKNAPALNGLGNWARDWVAVLEALTLRIDLRCLTMLRYADVLPARGLLRRTQAWCPACYEDWRLTKNSVYQPLLWNLEVVTTCSIHHMRLHLECPHEDCHRTVPISHPRSRTGHCPHCGRWLGFPLSEKAHEDKSLTEAELNWQDWVVNAVGELLVADPGSEALPQREKIAANFFRLAKQIGQGNRNELARNLQVSWRTLRDWEEGTQIPQLGMLLRLCYPFRISPLHFLTGEIEFSDPKQVRLVERSDLRRKANAHPRRFDVKKMRQCLEEVLANDESPTPSMCEVARRLKYGHAHLIRRFPDLCHMISERYKNYRRQESGRAMQLVCEEVRRVTFKIHTKGTYPSHDRLKRALSKPGYMRCPEARAAWHAALRELGWDKGSN
jgi:DNA-binding transcriptional regulator YiaG